MALEWLRRDNELKDHQLFDNSHFGKDAPTVIYEERRCSTTRAPRSTASTRPGSG